MLSPEPRRRPNSRMSLAYDLGVLTGDQVDHGGFAGAVGPAKRPMLTGPHRPVQIFQNRLAAVGHGHVPELDQGLARDGRTRRRQGCRGRFQRRPPIKPCDVLRCECLRPQTLEEHPPGADPHHVGDLGRDLAQTVGHEDYGAGAVHQGFDHRRQVFARRQVEAVERLVQHQYLRRGEQHPGDQHPPDLAVGKGADAPLKQPPDPETFDELSPGFRQGARYVFEQLADGRSTVRIPAERARLVLAALLLDQPAVVLKRHAGHPLQEPPGVRRENFALHHRHLAPQRPHQRGLAGAVRPDDRPMLPSPDRPTRSSQDAPVPQPQGDVVEGDQLLSRRFSSRRSQAAGTWMMDRHIRP